MRTFIIRRLILGIFIAFFGALVVYSVIRALPTSYVEAIARQITTDRKVSIFIGTSPEAVQVTSSGAT